VPPLEFQLTELMPRTFRHYVLPAAGIPVFYKAKRISIVDIPANGEFAPELDEAMCHLIRQGGALLRFRAEIVYSGEKREQEFAITSIEIEEV
jgi:hypothetical protein